MKNYLIKQIKKHKKSKDVLLFNIYVCMYVTILHIFFWYYLSSFGAVFQNTQYYLIKNVLISLGFCFLFPIIINILPAGLRIISLKRNNKELLYKFSKFMQII